MPTRPNHYARGLIAHEGSLGGSGPLQEVGSDIHASLDVDAAATMLWEFLTEEAKVLHEGHAALAEG